MVLDAILRDHEPGADGGARAAAMWPDVRPTRGGVWQAGYVLLEHRLGAPDSGS